MRSLARDLVVSTRIDREKGPNKQRETWLPRSDQITVNLNQLYLHDAAHGGKQLMRAVNIQHQLRRLIQVFIPKESLIR